MIPSASPAKSDLNTARHNTLLVTNYYLFSISLTHRSVLTHSLTSYPSSFFSTPHTLTLCTAYCSLRICSLLATLIPSTHNHKFNRMRRIPLSKPLMLSCLPCQTFELLSRSFYSMRIKENPSPCLHYWQLLQHVTDLSVTSLLKKYTHLSVAFPKTTQHSIGKVLA